MKRCSVQYCDVPYVLSIVVTVTWGRCFSAANGTAISTDYIARQCLFVLFLLLLPVTSDQQFFSNDIDAMIPIAPAEWGLLVSKE